MSHIEYRREQGGDVLYECPDRYIRAPLDAYGVEQYQAQMRGGNGAWRAATPYERREVLIYRLRHALTQQPVAHHCAALMGWDQRDQWAIAEWLDITGGEACEIEAIPDDEIIEHLEDMS